MTHSTNPTESFNRTPGQKT